MGNAHRFDISIGQSRAAEIRVAMTGPPKNDIFNNKKPILNGVRLDGAVPPKFQ